MGQLLTEVAYSGSSIYRARSEQPYFVTTLDRTGSELAYSGTNTDRAGSEQAYSRTTLDRVLLKEAYNGGLNYSSEKDPRVRLHFSEMPVLGSLFSRSTSEKSKQRLIIFRDFIVENFSRTSL